LLPNVALALTSYGGYVVFSQLDAEGRWRLMAWHHGSIASLDVPERSVPFDASAGPSAAGAPAVVFSKCVDEPPAVSQSPEAQVQPPDWPKARGCQIYELKLPGGAPQLVREIYTRAGSDSTPAIWMGNIAFARMTNAARVPSLYVWDHANGRLSRVGGGPSACPSLGATFGRSFCGHRPAGLSAWVDSMSLGSGGLAYQWILPQDDEQPFGVPDAEVRVDPLRAGRQAAPSQVVYDSILGGACNGEQGGSPDVMGGSVLYVWHLSVCGKDAEHPVAAIGSYVTATRKHGDVPISPGIAVAVTQDQGTTYWIRDSSKEAGQPACDSEAATCNDEGFDYFETCAPAHSVCTLMEAHDLVGQMTTK
jgi:hypothetical protein